MLTIRGLKVSYNGVPVINGLDISVTKGEAVSVIGESGAGKTTLGLCVMGLVEGQCSGEIIINNRNIFKMSGEDLRKSRGKLMSMVFQNTENALHPLYTVKDQVAEAILLHENVRRSEAVARAGEILHAVGIEGVWSEAHPHRLSGGQKQRVLIALALVNGPEVVILDEPTASLDVLTKEEIILLIKRLTRDKATLVITHDISTAARVGGRLAVMYAGKILEAGPTEEVLSNPRHPYTRGLIRSYPDMSATKDLQGIPGRMTRGVPGCPFHPRCTQKISVCYTEPPAPLESGDRQVACHRGGIVPLLEVEGLVKTFGSIEAVRGVNLTLYEGETLALVGESGSGKSTLAKMIIGIHSPDSGVIRLEGEILAARRPAEFYRKVQMVFQNPGESVSHRMNVLEVVREPLDVRGNECEDKKLDTVRRVLDEVELPGDDEFLSKYPHHLSGGEVQRLAIARALVLNPKILIADEPTSALDASVQAKILKLLLNLQEKRGLAILMITHDIALARKVSDRMAVMLKGEIVEEGRTAVLSSAPAHSYTKSLIGCMNKNNVIK